MAKIVLDCGDVRRFGADGKIEHVREYKLDCGCCLAYDYMEMEVFNGSYARNFFAGYVHRAAKEHRCDKAASFMGQPVVHIDEALGREHTTQWLMDWKPVEQGVKHQERVLNMQPLLSKISNDLWQEFAKNLPLDAPPPSPLTTHPWMQISEGSNFGPIPIFTKAELDEIRKAWRDAEEARFRFDRFQLIELD